MSELELGPVVENHVDDAAERAELEDFVRNEWVDENGQQLDDDAVQLAAARMQQLRKDIGAVYSPAIETETTDVSVSKEAHARLVGVERQGTTPTRIVQIHDADGNFLGFDPTDEQIREIAQQYGFSERETRVLWLDTLRYHQGLARTAFRELGKSGESILNRAAMGIRNHTTNDSEQGERG